MGKSVSDMAQELKDSEDSSSRDDDLNLN